jgi:hypothetical protein
MILEDKTMADKTVKVRVKGPYRVVHEGDPYSNSDELTVPEHVAEQWQRSGCIEKVTSKG